ncbi:hypothetical protein RHGRI_029273 [Rhododendron griersonianum]|uniref:DWD hypersensitive to UV-B 1 N-terminal domain-containing protein n=2 Tax=Rhododendron griersonianum TaxID=479676 RepID=A0AAV6IIT5_9ERIC|nr:hypothetical protein RHGRI_029273 [Rhododendron griersonianum]
MSPPLSTLETRYLDSCKRHEVEPNSKVLSWFYEAKIQKSTQQKCNMAILLDCLKDADFPPLVDVFVEVNSSDIDAVDITQASHCSLSKDFVISLLDAINLKLRIGDLLDISLVDDFLRDPSKGGLSCNVLNLRSSQMGDFNISGSFKHLHTLNLDFCASLTSLQKDSFACLPNLMRLSMCETGVTNLWTTSAALSKLTSLVELRFQNCMCCKGTGPCPVSFSVTEDLQLACHRTGSVEFSGHLQTTSSPEHSSDLLPVLDGMSNLQIEVSLSGLCAQDENKSPASAINCSTEDACTTFRKYVSHHPSPICFEKHYRVYMIISLPRLAVLDNRPIRELERETAKAKFSECYELLPYKRQHKESVVSILHMRETGASTSHNRYSSRPRQSFSYGKSPYFYSRSLCAAKLGCSGWPLLHPVSNICPISKDEGKSLRPRQFEYHPSNSSLMVFGTLDGEIIVINHENGHIIGYVPSLGSTNSVLGLCWLKTYPSKFLAGSDNGALRLYDMNDLLPNIADGYASPCNVTVGNFEQLTSVHVNATDDQLIASGYAKHVAIYDINSGKCLQLFKDMHQGPINVAKFAHHSPSIFVTSSFDRDIKMWDCRQNPIRPCYTVSSSRGNVMACFSPDDHHVLVSAVDNEVKQLMAVDGSLHTKFEIPPTGSSHNYTRSYYLNGRDYIISGSSDESVVRICCAQTGRRLRDVYLEDRSSRTSMFVQSLRGDPFRHFQMAVLATSVHPGSKSEIIKVNLLASCHGIKEYSLARSSRLGG